MNNSETEILDDGEIVSRLLQNDEKVICYFFFKKCRAMFVYILHQLFHNGVNQDELINELYLYLQANDWYKLRQFDFRSRLLTWTSVVAVRFFMKKRKILNNISQIPINDDVSYISTEGVNRHIDVELLLNQIKNERYRFLLRALIVEDYELQEIADKMEITIDNLYNLKRRALKSLIHLIENDQELCRKSDRLFISNSSNS